MGIATQKKIKFGGGKRKARDALRRTRERVRGKKKVM